MKRTYIFIVMKAYLALATTMLFKDIDKVLEFADNETKFYLAYTEKSDKYPAPTDISEILGFKQEGDIRLLFEHMYLQCLTYSYTVHQSKNAHADLHTVVIRMYQPLKNIFSFRRNTNSHKNHYIFWARRLWMLSVYSIKHNRLTETRNYLADADFLIQELYITIYKEDNPKNVLLHDHYQEVNTITKKTCIEFGLKLLHLSKEELLLRLQDDKQFESSDAKPELSKSEEQVNKLLFLDREEDLEEFAPITDQYVLCYEDAQTVLNTMLSLYDKLWLDDMLESYENYPNYISDISSAIKYVTFYNADFNTKIKLLGQRANILEMFLQRLNFETELNICQQVSVELATVFSNVMIILHMQEILGGLEQSTVIMNYLVKCSMHYLQWYFNVDYKPSTLVFVHDTNIWQRLFL